jgi:DNA-directed RNA polymerase beta' subunit
MTLRRQPCHLVCTGEDVNDKYILGMLEYMTNDNKNMEWLKKKKIAFTPEYANNTDEAIGGCTIPNGFNLGIYHRLNSKYYDFIKKYPRVELDGTIIRLFGDDDISSLIRLEVPLEDAIDDNKTGSVLDARMGTTSKSTTCKTCCQTMLTCQGHYGYIKLNAHFVHPSYTLLLNKILRSICHSCGDLLIGNKSPMLSTLTGFADKLTYADAQGSKGRQCKVCGFINPIVINPPHLVDHSKIDDLLIFMRTRVKRNKDDIPRYMKLTDIEKVLTRMTPDAIKSLYGDKHRGSPKDMIIKFIVVPPLLTRPVSLDAMDDSQLTEMYDHILVKNRDVFGGPDVITSDMSASSISTANYVYKLFINLVDKDVVYVRALSMFRNLKTMLSKKSGLVRNNGIGKRINYSSRTVLSPAGEANLGEISYPSEAAKIMTVPEPVTGYNIDKLRDEWIISQYNKPKRIFSINIQQPGHSLFGQTVSWRPNIEYKPYIGDIVNRTIRSGDMVVFDRQPTLDKYSLLGNQVILPERNLRVNGLNSCATKPANADFDGDEGNVNVLQSIGAQCEARILTNIRSNIISDSTSSPIVSIQYHGVVGLYKLSHDNVLLDKEDWVATFEKFWDNQEAFIPIYLHGRESKPTKVKDPTSFFTRLESSGIHTRSGKALLSSLLPSTCNYNRGDVKIRNGIITNGPFTKKDIGGSGKGLIAMLHQTYGEEVTANFLSSAQKMADWYLTLDPVSIGLTHINPINKNISRIGDMLEDDGLINPDIPELLKEDIIKEVWNAPNSHQTDINEWVLNNADKIGTLPPFVHSVNYFVSESANDIQNQVDLLPDRFDMSEYEKAEREVNILTIASKTNQIGRDIAKEVLGDDNPVVQLYKSGAKGSEGNIAQITASIGQTQVYGQRPGYQMGKTLEYPEGTKTLSFFRGKDSPDFKETIQSRGYVNSSYVRGTTPSQFIFSMSMERIGVITSRVSTSQSGFFARQIMKFLEEKLVSPKGDIVDTTGRYIAFSCFDGLSGTKLSNVKTMKYGDFAAPFDPQIIISKLVSKREQSA